MAKEKDQGMSKDFKTLQDKIQGTILESRRIFLSDAVMMESANDFIAKLWYLELSQPGAPILFVIIAREAL